MITRWDQQRWDVIISEYYTAQFSGGMLLDLVEGKRVGCDNLYVSGAICEDIRRGKSETGGRIMSRRKNLGPSGASIERELREAVAGRERAGWKRSAPISIQGNEGGPG